MMNPKVDFFFEKAKQWKEAFEQLRIIILDCGLVEELKWGVPCYTLNKKNVVLMHGFNEYCALLFHKGALLKDKAGLLVQQTKNVQAARQLRFTSVQEIMELETAIKAYIHDAIAVEKSGKKVPMKKTAEFDMPEEFKAYMEQEPGLKEAFKTLTPGRQRGYLLYFSQAKQSKTRMARIEKSLPLIFEGQGLND